MNRRPWRQFIFILVVSLLCAYVNLPFDLNPHINIAGQNLNFKIPKPSLDLNIGSLHFKRDLNFHRGLDLIGGTEVTLQADMSKISSDKRADALESARSIISRRVDLYGVAESSVRTSIAGEDYRLIVELPGVDKPQEALNLIGQTASLIFATPVYTTKESSASGSPTGFSPSNLTGADLDSATLTYANDTRQPAVSIKFKDSGTDKFAQLTTQYLNKPIAISLDGEIVTAPVVQSAITTGQAVISGNFTIDTAKLLATQLNAGALPIPIKVLTQQNISATLGAASINQSLIAGAVGLGIVVLFMVANYGWLGLIAVVALVVYTLITSAIYRLVPITLTLPGVAGFVLSVGMAVDSNILIFERYKEERRLGEPVPLALELAFGRAWDSIKDANIATIITGLILFNPLNWSFLNASGSIRGFALTLILGILVSLFTSIIVSRNLLRLFIHEKSSIKKTHD